MILVIDENNLAYQWRKKFFLVFYPRDLNPVF